MHGPKISLGTQAKSFAKRRLEFAQFYTFRGLDRGGRTADDHALGEPTYEHTAISSST